MGTEPVAQNESPPAAAAQPPARIEDVPRTGMVVWLLFLGFLLPPALVVYIGRALGPMPHQTLWVILLGLPGLLLLLSLPRKYLLEPDRLTILGLFYRKRVPVASILTVRRIGAARALASLGSVFCSDPRRALLIERERGLALVISPAQPEPFLALGERRRAPEAEP